MKFFPKIISFLLLSVFCLPFVISAQGNGLIVCDGGAGDPCEFSDLILLVKNGINLLVKVATLITVLALCYMGFTLITSGGKAEALSDVKKRGKAIIIGYLWIVAAWVIVYTIMRVLVSDDYILLQNPS